MANVYTLYEGSLKDALALYKAFYEDAPFVHVSENTIDLKMVVNTNKGIVQLQKDGEKNYWLQASLITL